MTNNDTRIELVTTVTPEHWDLLLSADEAVLKISLLKLLFLLRLFAHTFLLRRLIPTYIT